MKKRLIAIAVLAAAVGIASVVAGWSQRRPLAVKGAVLKGTVLKTVWTAEPNPAARPPNSVYIKGSAGERPFTISRVFAQGEIKTFAQARVNGQPVPTQCDVKTRWPDGSLQHALLSFWADARNQLEVSFIEQETGQNEGALTAEQMLSGNFDFDAQIEISNEQGPQIAQARRMLADGAFRFWRQGPICTQAIIEDRGDTAAYDLGWGEAKSFHPIFVATFYPGWRGVKVEFIGENAWSSKLQDLAYSLTLRAAQPQPVFQQARLTHLARTRWRKTFWSGPEPPQANIDYNLPYMVYSKVLPNFDLSKRVSDKAIESETATLQKQPERWTIEERGSWLPGFPTTGGRPDIGLIPRWYVRYLYTFDPRLYTLMVLNAEVSGHIPIHYREADATRFFDPAQKVPACGRIISIDGRPGFVSRDQTKSTPADRIDPLAPYAKTIWDVDIAHQPSFAFVPYLITGDWYFLEEIYFWAAYNIAFPDWMANTTCINYCRIGAWGYLVTQIRGEAWGLRTMAHAAFFAPDGSPEKAYFLEKVLNNIALREGKLNVTDGHYYDTDQWRFGRSALGRGVPNPLYYLDFPSAPNVAGIDDQYVEPAKTYARVSPFTENFNYIVWGHMQELGFPTGPLRRAALRHLLHQLRDPDYNPYLCQAYRMPLAPAKDTFFDNWAAVKDAFTDSLENINHWENAQVLDVEHGYPLIAYAAASFMGDVQDGNLNGLEAWTWLKNSFPSQTHDRLNDNPKWALLPRPAEPGDQTYTAAWNRRYERLRGSLRPIDPPSRRGSR